MDFNQLSSRYTGDVANAYDAEREGGAKWRSEQKALGEIVGSLPAGLSALDVPVGTGRLFPFYKRRDFTVTGIDISRDMLEKAQARGWIEELDVSLRIGDIRALPVDDASFDLVSCIRFLNWVDRDGLLSSLAELTRASRTYVLVGIRHLRPFAEFRATPADLVRAVRRWLGHADARAHRSGLVYHEKETVLGSFALLGLSIVREEVVEQRSDGTDYMMYLLRKLPDE